MLILTSYNINILIKIIKKNWCINNIIEKNMIKIINLSHDSYFFFFLEILINVKCNKTVYN